MDKGTIALFGEAEKGLYHTAYYCQHLHDLVDHLGNPPPESRGLFCAVQALLFRCDILFFRVGEEGFSVPDYLASLEWLRNARLPVTLSALAAPGVGSTAILHPLVDLCAQRNTILIMSEADLYDYLTALT